MIQNGDSSITDYLIKLGVISHRAKEGHKKEVRHDVTEPSIEEKVASAAKNYNSPKNKSEQLPNGFELPSSQSNVDGEQ